MTEPPKLEDLDPVETREWLESIDSSHSRVSTGSRSSSFGGSVMRCSRGAHRARGLPARDRMSNDGEQRQVKQVSASALSARGGALLPSAPAPAIESAREAKLERAA